MWNNNNVELGEKWSKWIIHLEKIVLRLWFEFLCHKNYFSPPFGYNFATQNQFPNFFK